MKHWIPIFVLALAGCANDTQPPAYVEVKVPVPILCKTVDVRPPSFAVDQLPIGATIDSMRKCEHYELNVTSESDTSAS